MLSENWGCDKPHIFKSIPLHSAGRKRAEAVEICSFPQNIQDFLTGLASVEPGLVAYRIKYRIWRNKSSIGYGLDLLEEAKAANCTIALNGAPGCDLLHAAPLSRFVSHGFNHGHGRDEERFLALRFWDTLGRYGRIKRAKLPRRPELVQGYLFGEA